MDGFSFLVAHPKFLVRAINHVKANVIQIILTWK